MKNVSSKYDIDQVIGFVRPKDQMFFIGKITEVHIRKNKKGEVTIHYDISGNDKSWTVAEADVVEYVANEAQVKPLVTVTELSAVSQ